MDPRTERNPPPEAPVSTDRERWNEQYRNKRDEVGPAASWVAENRDLLEAQPRGRALDVACGRGRNALLLAELGFTVDALDVSEVALELLGAEAERRGVTVNTRRADLREAPAFEAGAYAVVLDMFFLERPLLPTLIQALAPGGLLFFETFTTKHLKEPWGPSSSASVLSPGELLGLFADLEAVRHHEGVVHGDRPRQVAQLVARAPAAFST